MSDTIVCAATSCQVCPFPHLIPTLELHLSAVLPHHLDRPCAANPDLFLQPGEREDWALTEEAGQALDMCARCPLQIKRECARSAITAGTTADGFIAAVADGVIQAGVVCRGDMGTLRELRKVAGSGDAACCLACGRPFTEVGKKALGLCSGCYTASRRSGGAASAKPRPELPTSCLDCGAPMVSATAVCPPGSVPHRANGRCHMCDMRFRRSRRAA